MNEVGPLINLLLKITKKPRPGKARA